MGKNAAQKAQARKLAQQFPGDRTPKAGPKVVTLVDATSPPPQPKMDAAEPAAQQKAAADAAKMAQEEEQASRRQVIDKLPELRRLEGLVPATNMANYNLVPLRSGKAAEGYWDETTSKEKVMEKESFNWKIIQKEVDAHSAGMGTRALLPLGRSSLAQWWPLAAAATRIRRMACSSFACRKIRRRLKKVV